jgi:hypothetical protein
VTSGPERRLGMAESERDSIKSLTMKSLLCDGLVSGAFNMVRETYGEGVEGEGRDAA